MEIEINGSPVSVRVDPAMPLLWVLRDALGLTGTKYGCGTGACGACTVIVDGRAMRSCVVPVSAMAGRRVATIEMLAAPEGDPRTRRVLESLREAWIEEQVAQCGYCQPGMIMAAAAFLKDTPNPTEDDIKAGITNLCRCGTYPRIKKAILRAAADARKG